MLDKSRIALLDDPGSVIIVSEFNLDITASCFIIVVVGRVSGGVLVLIFGGRARVVCGRSGGGGRRCGCDGQVGLGDTARRGRSVRAVRASADQRVVRCGGRGGGGSGQSDSRIRLGGTDFKLF